jgi:hypothetical protein
VAPADDRPPPPDGMGCFRLRGQSILLFLENLKQVNEARVVVPDGLDMKNDLPTEVHQTDRKFVILIELFVKQSHLKQEPISEFVGEIRMHQFQKLVFRRFGQSQTGERVSEWNAGRTEKFRQ